MHLKRKRTNVFLAMVALMSPQASADFNYYTRGIDFRNQTTWSGLSNANLSLMGGVPVYIKATGGLSMDAAQNIISLESKNIPQAQFIQPPLSDDDAFNSNTAAGLLGWTIPAAADIFSTPTRQYTYFDFNNLPNGLPGAYPSPSGGVNYLTFGLSVSSGDDSPPCYDPNFTRCAFTYNQRFTPQLIDTVPNQVYAGMPMSFWLNAGQIFSVLPKTYDPFYYVNLGGYLTDYDGLIDVNTRLPVNRVSSVTARAPSMPSTASADPDLNFSMFGRTFIRSTARHCNFAGDDCWTVRVHASILSISASTGYVDGGQMLTITGKGFSGDEVTVTVDGVECIVQSSDETEIVCETQSKGVSSLANFSQPGHHGSTLNFMNPVDPLVKPSLNDFTSNTYPKTTSLAMTLETQAGSWDSLALWVQDGWFKAPATGNYRFFISADDTARLYMDTSLPFDPTAEKTSSVYTQANWVAHSYFTPGGFRAYERVPSGPCGWCDSSGDWQSNFFALNEGSFYKYQFQHIDYWGGYWSSVAVEFSNGTDFSGHPQASKSMQNLRIEQTNTNAETWTVTILNPNYKDSYVLQLVNTATGATSTSATIKTTDGSSSLGTFLSGFYLPGPYGSTAGISTDMYDSNGVLTNNVTSLVTKIVFTIKPMKRLPSNSFVSATFIPVGGSGANGTFPFGASINIQRTLTGAKPLSGNFVISCPDPQGNVWSTRPQNFITNITRFVEDIQSDIDEDIPWLKGKVRVHEIQSGTMADNFKFNYRVNGLDLYLTFDGLDFEAPQCTIQSDTTSPILGDGPLFFNEKLRTYGESLMFEPVGTEFLYTDAKNPQVMVDIDGIFAVCPKLNCDYAYVQATEQITSQSYNSASRVITVTGTGLPSNNWSLSFGGASCDPEIAHTATSTQISCTLKGVPHAGSHKVEIRVAGGLIPFASGVADITIDLVANSVSPTSINPLGGAILSITGSGFPECPMMVSIMFSDGTGCEILTTSPTFITCKVQGFSNLDGLDRTITVTVDNVRYLQRRRELYSVVPVTDSSLTISCMTNIPKVLSISDNNVSPVLKTEITFQLDSNYLDTLQAADLTVFILAAGYSRQLYVISADDATKSFVVKFNGAPVGTYTFSVFAASTSQYDFIDMSAVTLTTSATITSISTLQGSCYGGTKLVITGTNFSPILSDQAIKVGDYYCDISDASETELSCQIRETGLTSGTYNDNQVLVILWASSYASCTLQNLCMFTFVPPVETIDSVTATYNDATKAIEVSAIGTGFTSGSAANASLIINGNEQTLVSVDSDTLVTFAISNVSQAATSSIIFYFEDGLPEGYRNLTPLTLTPTWASVSPSVGSMGGTLLTVIAPGVGTKTSGLNLFDVTANRTVCTQVNVITYGQFTCMTGNFAITPTDSLQLVLSVVNATGSVLQQTYAPANALDCSYSQELDVNTPQISAASVSGSVITFTGSNFPTTGYTAKASFKHQKVDVDAGWSATSASATFLQGIPSSVQSQNVLPVLEFTDANGAIFVAYSNFEFTPNALDVSSITSSSSVQSSYAGGLRYTVSGVPNLLVSLQEPGNSIQVCGNVCEMDEGASTSDSVSCTLPSLTTTFSAETYRISESGKLDGTWASSNGTSLSNVLDGNWPSEFIDNNANCFVELAFPPGQVGILDSSKFIINNLPANKLPFLNVLKLVGWDGSAWQTVWTADLGIHEGWNVQTFPAGSKPAFYKYRYTGTTAGACRLGEVEFSGMVAVTSTSASYSCPVNLLVDASSTSLNSVTYSNTKTPTIATITPRYGSVIGNELITIIGTNFVDGSTSVTIDGITCEVQSVTSTQITCRTGSRPGDQPNPSFLVFVEGSGLAATQGNTFHYAQYWSEPSTWGYDLPPQEGEAVQIPAGRTLLVDVDVVPKLSFVLVQGSLIFAPHQDPTHERFFDAVYIFIQDGYMEVGTDAFPYTSKLTITMHGDVSTPALPTYGNKNIAVRGGTLSMVGVTRPVVWTMLDSTAMPGDTSITLLSQPVGFDWAIGEQIVIASTSFDMNQAETRTIISVGADASDSTKPVLTLDRPLVYKHYAASETYGTKDVDFRAEVGLLSRNVKYRGDPETSAKNKYGAHIMLHMHGDESCIGRIMYVELTDVGQAFKLGRYPIHFHLIGTVAKSIVKGNSIHQTYNRAVTIHAVSYFNVVENVIYNTMGHSIFIEDGIEEHNVIDGNLVIGTHRSWSLLNSDQTPASFWITNPNNVLINNHAAGSDRYGFWYDLKKNPSGPSFTLSVCPENVPLGEFRNNVAHSNGRYGFRGFHNHVPRTYPCQPFVFNADTTLPGYPYPLNPVIPAVYRDFVGWKNGHNGAIAQMMGAVIWSNFTVADNLDTGLEWSWPHDSMRVMNMSYITNSTVIGVSGNTEVGLVNTPWFYGVITPRQNDWFGVYNTSFFNFNFNTAGGNQGSAAFGDCSQCFFADSTDSGARTITLGGLSFDSSVSKRIKYQQPWRGIYHDLDGSMTGLGPDTWASANFQHNEQPECTTDMAVFDGQICDSTVQVRRVVLYQPQPLTINSLMMRVVKYDDQITSGMSATQLHDYQYNLTGIENVLQTIFKDPGYSWALPYVTGHKYRFFFGIGAQDFTQIQLEQSVRWKTTDKSIEFNYAYLDHYEDIDVFNKAYMTFANKTTGALIASGTKDPTTASTWLTGFNLHDYAKQEFNFAVTGNVNSSRFLSINAVRCRENLAPWCGVSNVTSTCSGTPLLWSSGLTWNGNVPAAGKNVTIPEGQTIIFDLDVSPVYATIFVQGCLQFLSDNSKDQHLKAQSIYVQKGKFTIGTAAKPYTKKATITLYGDPYSWYASFGGIVQAGNKGIFNTGFIGFYGNQRSAGSYMSRLTSVAQKGATTIHVSPGLDWKAGEVIGLAPSGTESLHFENATISSYDSTSGVLVVSAPLQFYHFGAASSTGQNYHGLDMRCEVILLNRNILIQGDMTQSDWPGQFVTSDSLLVDGMGNQMSLQGLTILNNVEFYNLGQPDTDNAAIRFDHSNLADGGSVYSNVSNCVIHDSGNAGIYIFTSRNINFQDNYVWNSKVVGVIIDIVTNVNFDKVHVFGTTPAIADDPTLATKSACASMCTWSEFVPCFKSSYTNSIVAGCQFVGFIGHGHSCSDPVGASSTSIVKNITAHSVLGSGVSIKPDPACSDSWTCYQFSDVKAYKVSQAGVAVNYQGIEVRVNNVVLVDNSMGIFLAISEQFIGKPVNYCANKTIKLFSSFIYGESADLHDDCPDPSTGASCYCPNKFGFMASYIMQVGKDAHILEAANRPIYNVKSNSCWNGAAYIENVQFQGFKTRTTCNARQSILAFADNYEPDQIPPHLFTNTKFVNVDPNAIAYLRDPPSSWANINDCGSFPCTGDSNSVWNFHDSVWQVNDSVTPLPSFWTAGTTSYDFQVVGKVSTAGDTYDDCTFNSEMNAYLCAPTDQSQPLNIGVLEFESLDGDRETRSVQPVIVTNTKGYLNKLNAAMDHSWDGFYTSQLRLQRFVAQVETGQTYTVTYTGTPPNNMRYYLRAESGNPGIIVRVPYPNAASYGVTVNGNHITPLGWNPVTQERLSINPATAICGTNRYLGVLNVLEFFVTPNCVVNVFPQDAIMSTVRLQWTANQFFAGDGVTTFIQRVASVLGITPDRVKVVAVYEGSLNVVYTIISNMDEVQFNDDGSVVPSQTLYTELNTLQAILTRKIVIGNTMLGAPVIEQTSSIQTQAAVHSNISPSGSGSGSSEQNQIICEWCYTPPYISGGAFAKTVSLVSLLVSFAFALF